MNEVFEEEIENTVQETPPEEVEPPMEEPETVIEELTIVEDDVKVDDVNINSEADENTKTSTSIVQTFEVEVEEEVEPIAFAVVEDKPVFRITSYNVCYTKLLRFIISRIRENIFICDFVSLLDKTDSALINIKVVLRNLNNIFIYFNINFVT